MIGRRQQKGNGLVANGNSLVQEYLSSLNNLVLVESLKYSASQNEAKTLEALTNSGSNNNVFVTPKDIPIEQQAEIAKASVNAHLQKAQASQIESFTAKQQESASAQVQKNFLGKKVTVEVLDRKSRPVDACWLDVRTGSLKVTEYNTLRVKGVIEKISLDQNLLILRPTLLTRTVNKTLQYYRVYVIDPTTMLPMVRLNIL